MSQMRDDEVRDLPSQPCGDGALPILPPNAEPSAALNTPWSFVPWHVSEGDAEVRSRDGWLVCTTCGDDFARLIAAAPDLYETLQRVDRWINTHLPAGTYAATTMLGIVREAISKADGRR